MTTLHYLLCLTIPSIILPLLQIEAEFEIRGMCLNSRKWMVEECSMHDKQKLREIFESFNVFLVDPNAADSNEPDDQNVNRI